MFRSRIRARIALAFVLVASCVSSVGCAASDGGEENDSSQEAIVGGAESLANPAVGYIMETGDPEPVCTGTLIAPNVVLTAAHCIDPKLKQSFGTGRFKSAPVIAATAKVHPLYNKSKGGDSKHDYAYLVLAKSVEGIAPVAIRRTQPAATCDYAGIGYGIALKGYNADKPNPKATTGARKAATSLCVAKGLPQGMLSVNRGNGAPCFGDSGGPLLTKSGELVGVVAYSNTAICSGTETNMYAAAVSNLAFIDEALGRAAP